MIVFSSLTKLLTFSVPSSTIPFAAVGSERTIEQLETVRVILPAPEVTGLLHGGTGSLSVALLFRNSWHQAERKESGYLGITIDIWYVLFVLRNKKLRCKKSCKCKQLHVHVLWKPWKWYRKGDLVCQWWEQIDFPEWIIPNSTMYVLMEYLIKHLKTADKCKQLTKMCFWTHNK